MLLAGLTRWRGPDARRLASLAATVRVAGSVYTSEIRHFHPCTWCWYQRIGMYPLVVLLGVAALRRDGAVYWYAMPLAIVGAVVGAYHYQLERFPEQAQIAC